jgi:Domain of unknown function (DUF4351)
MLVGLVEALAPELQEWICGLSIAQLEDLAEALLDFFNYTHQVCLEHHHAQNFYVCL